jgi:hypothetical protein
MAVDVTDLHKNRVELTRENQQLRKVQTDLKRLSANVVAITREEEILNTKMRVHDEMGRCLLAVQKYLKDDSAEKIPESIVDSWRKAVSSGTTSARGRRFQTTSPRTKPGTSASEKQRCSTRPGQ